MQVAPSRVAGRGLYVLEDCAKNDFIGEYTGEIISQAEADGRGHEYDRNGTSYLFNLNSEQVVDATHMGGKVRFINHSSQPNCYPLVKRINGDQRIGIYARAALPANRELLLDYRYSPEHLKFVSKENRGRRRGAAGLLEVPTIEDMRKCSGRGRG